MKYYVFVILFTQVFKNTVWDISESSIDTFEHARNGKLEGQEEYCEESIHSIREEIERGVEQPITHPVSNYRTPIK